MTIRIWSALSAGVPWVRELNVERCYCCGKLIDTDKDDCVWVSGKGYLCRECFRKFGV